MPQITIDEALDSIDKSYNGCTCWKFSVSDEEPSAEGEQVCYKCYGGQIAHYKNKLAEHRKKIGKNTTPNLSTPSTNVDTKIEAEEIISSRPNKYWRNIDVDI